VLQAPLAPLEPLALLEPRARPGQRAQLERLAPLVWQAQIRMT